MKKADEEDFEDFLRQLDVKRNAQKEAQESAMAPNEMTFKASDSPKMSKD